MNKFNKFKIALLAIILTGCVTQLPMGGSLPESVNNINLVEQPFDGSLMSMPLGSHKIEESEFIVFEINRSANGAGMLLGPFGVLLSDAMQSSANSGIVDGYGSVFSSVNLHKITTDLTNNKYAHAKAALKSNAGNVNKATVSTYCIMQKKDSDLYISYVTKAEILDQSGEEIWQNTYRASSPYRSVASVAASQETLQQDAETAIEKNLTKLLIDLLEKKNISHQPANTGLITSGR